MFRSQTASHAALVADIYSASAKESPNISWHSKKQIVALSSTEAKNMSSTKAACEAVWLRRTLEDLGLWHSNPTIIYCDNMSAIAMTKNPIFQARRKNIEIRHHFIQDLVNKGLVKLEFVDTNDQPANMLKKPLTIEKFEKFKFRLNIAK